MKRNLYKVTFCTGVERTEYAFSREEATILAQAEEIKAGHDYTVYTCVICCGR